MKRFYVTEKSVKTYIKQKVKELGLSDNYLLYKLSIELADLEKYPEENKSQITFYKKVAQNLTYNINRMKLKNQSIINGLVEYHRNPTNSEIKFGEGAMHYKDFDIAFCLNGDGNLKKWLVCPIDKLRYYR